MADYTRYKTDTLKKMREKAYDNYIKEASKPAGNDWGAGMRRAKLPTFTAWEKAKARLDAIDAELKRRRMEGIA